MVEEVSLVLVDQSLLFGFLGMEEKELTILFSS
jgi:hypothetical protein